MYETFEEIDALQELLDRSYLNAGAHLRAVLTPEKRITAQQLCSLLEGINVLDLATVNRAGKPMVAPVDGLFFHGRFYFGSADDSVRFKHIRNNPYVSAAHTRGVQFSLLIHGTAELIDTRKEIHNDLHAYFREVYGAEYDDWGYWGHHPHARIEPSKMFATVFDESILHEEKW